MHIFGKIARMCSVIEKGKVKCPGWKDSCKKFNSNGKLSLDSGFPDHTCKGCEYRGHKSDGTFYCILELKLKEEWEQLCDKADELFVVIKSLIKGD